MAGSLVGVSLGALLSAATRLSPITKTGLLVSLSMVCCFLAGLMMEGISYQVAQNAPAVAWLNPAARIADAFYCLYYFDTYHRFFLDIGVLLAMAAAGAMLTSIAACGSPSKTERSMNAPGSPSSALQQTYF